MLFRSANLVCLPVMGALLWQMGLKNFPKWLLIIPAIILTDLDHFILTNVPGFGAHPAPGQKILHVAHTVEFMILEALVFTWYFIWGDPRRGRNLKTWLFPVSGDYAAPWRYYLAWAARIILIGVIIHWLIDLLVYFQFKKWDILYKSLWEYFSQG